MVISTRRVVFERLAYLQTKYRYLGHRFFYRIVMGREKRNKLFAAKGMNIGMFVRKEQIMYGNGIRAMPRPNTDDFSLLFVPREHGLLTHMIMYEGELFIDVGSNVGYYTLKTMSIYKDNVKAIAIEAHPQTYRALQTNIQLNYQKNFDINAENPDYLYLALNKAVSDQKGIVKINEHVEKNNFLWAGHSSIVFDFNDVNDKESVKERPVVINVPSDTLDNIIEEFEQNNKIRFNVGVVKIDIEGAEVSALKGSPRILQRARKEVVEIHGDTWAEVVRILNQSEYETSLLRVEDRDYVIGVNKRRRVDPAEA